MILEIIEEDRYLSFTYANWYRITVKLHTAWILSSYRNICMKCGEHMTTRFHFPIQLRVNQEQRLDEQSRIDFCLYLVLSGQTLTTIISFIPFAVFFSCLHLFTPLIPHFPSSILSLFLFAPFALRFSVRFYTFRLIPIPSGSLSSLLAASTPHCAC